MADLTKFKVMRRHDGDRMYEEGEIREALEVDVKHLVPHVLKPLGKAEVVPANKAEPAPANKAGPVDHEGNGRKGGGMKSRGAK